jgi:protein gp37
MSDLFHKDIPLDFIVDVFETMKKAHWHTFQILTKRPERMKYFTNKVYNDVLPNVWLGTTIENRDVLYRLDELKKVRAKIKFVSFEPLLESVGKVDLRGIDWAIVGGESGPNRRAMDKQWVKEIRSHCRSAGIPFFFKQWGGRTPKSGGRMLDGKIYDEYPEAIQSFQTFDRLKTGGVFDGGTPFGEVYRRVHAV